MPSDAATSLVARQPILDRSGRIRGHELLFRDGTAPAERATATALGALTAGLPAWIEVSPELLLELDPFPVAAGSVVLELAARTPVDERLVERLERLRGEGHAIALDDWFPRPDRERLLPYADYVKLDLPSYGVHGLRAVMARLPTGPARPQVVVVNVSSPTQLEAVHALGADLVQGFFFEVPERVEDRSVPVDRVDRLRRLVAMPANPTFEEVERVVAADPGLTVRLLRFANSAAIGARRRFGSVRDAMVLLGSDRVRQLLMLVALSELGAGRPALVAAAVLRGRLAEAIARDLRIADPDTAFTAGVLSVVDALLDRKMVEVLKGLPITEELRWAILGRSGPVGAALDLAIRIERGRAGAEGERFRRLDEALRWSDQALGGLTA